MSDGEIFDTDLDGYAETVTVDYDGDGYAETVETDTDLDGYTDVAAVDTDLDGYAETTLDLTTGDVSGSDASTGEEYVDLSAGDGDVVIDDSTDAMADYYAQQQSYEMMSEMSEMQHQTNMEIIDNIDGTDDYYYEDTTY